MNIDGMKAQLSKIERQRRTLEKRIQMLQKKELTALPVQVGLDTVDHLILALAPHASPALRVKLESLQLNGFHGDGEEGDAQANGKRARFPEDLRLQVKAELEKGTKSVAQLSREYGPSHPTIMGWKREWGMTHPRPRRNPPAR